MLSAGTHVKIGTYEYTLAEDMDGHYQHSFNPNYAQRNEVEGAPGKVTGRNDRLLWAMDSWTGGEGARVFDGSEPDVYSFSNGANGRNPGQLTGRPSRTYLASTLTTNDLGKRPILAQGDGSLWYGGGYRIGYTTDGTTNGSWTIVNSTGTAGTDFTGLQSLNTSFYITAMAGDANYIYYAAFRSGNAIILRRDASNAAIPDTVVSSGTYSVPIVGLSFMGGNLYAWTGRRMYELNIAQSVPLAAKYRSKVYDTGVDPFSTHIYGNTWWGDSCSTENAVFAFYSRNGTSDVYMYRNDVPRQVWRAPYGFTIKSIGQQNGVIFFAGHWSAGTSTRDGWGALYAMPTDTLQPVFVTWFRRHTEENLQMQEMGSSYGSQIMVTGANTGKFYIYDMDADGISMLDFVATSGAKVADAPASVDASTFVTGTDRIGAIATYGTGRFFIQYDTSSSSSGSYKLRVYEDEEPTQRQAGTATASCVNTLTSPKHDFGYIHESKALHGFHLTYEVEDTATTSGLKTGQEILVEYKLDGANWATAATVTSSTTPTSGVKGRTFIAISGATKFYSISVRISVYGKYVSSTGYQPPIVLALTTEASLTSYTEVWDLIVRVKDEQANAGHKNRKWRGEKLRDYLEDLAQSASSVTLLDGYRYRNPGQYTTHTVIVEGPEDNIVRNAEGFARIRLRSVNNG